MKLSPARKAQIAALLVDQKMNSRRLKLDTTELVEQVKEMAKDLGITEGEAAAFILEYLEKQAQECIDALKALVPKEDETKPQ